MVKKVWIIGPPGCGKTTLAKQLSVLLDYPAYHLDNLFWKKNWCPESDIVFCDKTIEIVGTEEWIIDGDYSQVSSRISKEADRVILIKVSLPVLLFNVVRRSIRGCIKKELICGENYEKISRLFGKKGMVKYTIMRYQYYKKIQSRPTIFDNKLIVVRGCFIKKSKD